MRSTSRLDFWTLLALSVLVWLLWDSWLVYPLKLLVVFFHELSHGLAALLTGGSIERIEMVAQEGGLCVTRGGSRFLVLNAGYLGSLFWGGVILLVARSALDKAFQLLLGLILLLTTLIWVRPFWSFGFGFAFLAALGLIAAGLLLSGSLNDLILKLTGLTSILYAPLDILDDILTRQDSITSDASMLARLTGIPTLIWGILWMFAALSAAFIFLRAALRQTAPRHP